MALFQRKPMEGSTAPLYTLGLNKTVLVVGLGNPGSEYGLTRHNIGFACLDDFAEKQDVGSWLQKKDLKCLLATADVTGTRIILAKPTTYMNASGVAVEAVQQFYNIATSNVLVVYDELDIPFGQIRTKTGGGSAGHNGVKSLIKHIGEGFARIRIGIGNEHSEKLESADFVLAKFSKDEQTHLPAMQREVLSLLTEYSVDQSFPPQTRSFIN